MLVCMPTILLYAGTHILAKFDQVREINVSMESHNMTRAHKLAYMQAIFLHAHSHILAKLGQIRNINGYIESGEQVRHV